MVCLTEKRGTRELVRMFVAPTCCVPYQSSDHFLQGENHPSSRFYGDEVEIAAKVVPATFQKHIGNILATLPKHD